MAYKLLDVLAKLEYILDLDKILEKKEIVDSWRVSTKDKEIRYSMIVEEKNSEVIIDQLSKILHLKNGEVDRPSNIENNIIISSIDAFLPKIKSIEDDNIKKIKQNKKAVDRITTEEIYDEINSASRTNHNFILNIILASIVCSLGIIKQEVSVLIAASAIAPFLASIIAYSFSIAIGDEMLRKRSLSTLLTGVGLSVFIGVVIGFIWNYLPNTSSIDFTKSRLSELSFTHYNFILALASGASASLAITAGTPTIMAGFMISVSLLPNMTISGITLGNQNYSLFLDSILLLMINIICIIFSSSIVFAFKKIKPKTKENMEVSKNNNIANIVYCIFILIILCILAILVKFR